MTMQIECPKCAKRLTAEGDLTGKTVECGSCDHRFVVDEEVIVSDEPRFYPGEKHKEDFLSRLGKQPAPLSSSDAPIVPPPSYDDSEVTTPISRLLAMICGLSFIGLYALIFVVGTAPEGIFKDVLLVQRLILSSFVSVISAGLIIGGAKTWRGKAILVAVLLVVGTIALTLFRPIQTTPVMDTSSGATIRVPKVEVGDRVDEGDVKARVGYRGVQRNLDHMIAKHGSQGSRYVVGVFAKNLTGSSYHEVEKYFKQAFKIPNTEGISRYKRNGEKDSLIVISGVRLDFDKVAEVCERLGAVVTYPEYRLVEVETASALFGKLDEDLLERVSDPSHPGFFAENLKELAALDGVRANRAVTRLATIPSGLEIKQQEAIAQALIDLLSTDADFELLGNLGSALQVYASKDASGLKRAAEVVDGFIEQSQEVPPALVAYLIEGDHEKAPLFVDLMWVRDFATWSPEYLKLGSQVEQRLLYHIQASPLPVKKEAIVLLEGLGTSQAIPQLERVISGDVSDLKILAERAIEGIQTRL